MMYIGLDIGSTSANGVLMSADGSIREERTERIHGQPVEGAQKMLGLLLNRCPADRITGIAMTGTGGKLISEILGCFFINEIIAQSTATRWLYPEIRTIIEIGGQDAKLIQLEPDPQTGRNRIRGFAMNTVCAAGTGSFLDQQAARLGIRIENEFGALALKSAHPPRIAGRCSVFAKSDMIHLQQIATPDCDIIMGLCLAMARNFNSNTAKGAVLQRPIAFQGGVAANRGMVRAFESVLDLHPGELRIPEHVFSMGAVGAVLALLGKGCPSPFVGPAPLEDYLRAGSARFQRHEPLRDDGYPIRTAPLPPEGPFPAPAYLGIDVGSISTNLVVIDRKKRVIARRYLMTAGRPIEAVRSGLLEIGREIGDRVLIRGVTVTGSGRTLIGDFIGADSVKNEITAHARGAVSIDLRVDTIFEIGGQDSKYIRLENGAVVDFTMNKVCAAGTGSFLEEQSEKLGVRIKNEFSELALAATAPADLGERCTVFMESSLNHQQQQGVGKEDLIAGLSYSIVSNYLNRVVEGRSVGDHIFFQGGTAYNRGVKAAFEKVCGKPITVPEHHDVLGALGSALIAREGDTGAPSRFKGFDLARRSYTVESANCTDCPNRCEIRRVSIEGEPPLHYGSRCGKLDEERREKAGRGLPQLFAERERLLMRAYPPPSSLPDDAPTVGIPRAALFFEMYPFWQAFFSALGIRVVTSAPTTRKTIGSGCEAVVEEICFPIKVAHGHVQDLLERKVDYLLLACVVNMEHVCTDAAVSYNCPFVQSLPYLVNAAIDFRRHPKTRVLKPTLHLEWGRRGFEPPLRQLARTLGRRGPQVKRAIDAACNAQQTFRESLARRGRQVLENLPEGTPALVVVSRPYNGCDPGLNFRIPDKLRDLGALAVPLDFLPVPNSFGPDMRTMYWRNGQRILSAARTIARSSRLNAVYLTNFSCGPDSFILKYFRNEMHPKPFLTLELDEHSADAGVVTRLEAFLDSLHSAPSKRQPDTRPPARPRTSRAFKNHKKIYIPYMDDHGQALASALRYNGLEAEALPMADSRSMELGRRFTTGKECYPCIITTGDIVKKTLSEDFDPDRSGFFMPSAMGPCRFGQYNRFHRLVLDGLGLTDVPMVLLDQTLDFDSDLSGLGRGVRLIGWKSLVLIDYLKKLALQTRPYEVTPGETDRVYRECLDEIFRQIEKAGTLNSSAEQSADRFASIKVDAGQRRPLVGVVGEIFVRSNRFSNDFFIRRVEALGGEVIMPTLQEWVAYTDWDRRRSLRAAGSYRRYLTETVKALVQERCVRSISRAFRGRIRHFFREAPTRHAMNLCTRYCASDIKGEATLSLGRAVEYARHGLQGIANLTPFNCMPGTIVNTLLTCYTRDYPDIPVLKMVYDGTRRAGDQTRIEAFMHQAQQRLETSGGNGKNRTN